jgi:hypothetical protein
MQRELANQWFANVRWQAMDLRCLTVLAIGPLLVIAGCAGEPAAVEPKAGVEAKEERLTAEAAKRALLEMGVQQIPPGVLVPPPKDVPVQAVGADEISIGLYYCNLKDKTFHASAFYPNADRHKFNHVSGVFERTAEGKWVAKITESSSGH